MYNAIVRVLDVFETLILTLDELSEEHGEATALGYSLQLKNLEVLAHFAILKDLLYPFFKIDKNSFELEIFGKVK